MNDHQERDDQEESNSVSRRDQQDTSHPSELEVGALRMTQKMQTMKEKMDMMMNVLKGRVSTNLDELVHHTNSPFTAPVTSIPLLAKFRMPQVKAYDRSKDPSTTWSCSKPLCTCKSSRKRSCANPSLVSKIAPNSVSTFKELSGLFVTHFVVGQRHKRSLTSILNVKQRDAPQVTCHSVQ